MGVELYEQNFQIKTCWEYLSMPCKILIQKSDFLQQRSNTEGYILQNQIFITFGVLELITHSWA